MTALAKDNAAPKEVHVDAFWVVGIPVRTSNAQEKGSDAVIGQLWKRFLDERILSNIPRKADSNIVAVYSDYESDENGGYRYTLGAKVNAIDKLPHGMAVGDVVSGKYAVFTTDRGPVAQVVQDTWKRIWSYPHLNRAFKSDFEVYDERAKDPQNAQVDIYVGVK